MPYWEQDTHKKESAETEVVMLLPTKTPKIIRKFLNCEGQEPVYPLVCAH